MFSSKTRARWTATVPGRKNRSGIKTLKTVVKTAFAATAISAAYFGTIAVLMSPAFNVVPGA